MDDSAIIFGIVLITFVLLIIFYILLNKNNNNQRRHNRWYGGCDGTRYGCCPDGVTVKEDQWGSNCVPRQRHHHHDQDYVGGCRGTRYGCCPDGVTASNSDGSNCREYFNSKGVNQEPFYNEQFNSTEEDMTHNEIAENKIHDENNMNNNSHINSHLNSHINSHNNKENFYSEDNDKDKDNKTIDGYNNVPKLFEINENFDAN